MKCRLDFCANEVKAAGLCSRHYEAQRTGKPFNSTQERKARTASGARSILKSGHVQVHLGKGDVELEHRMTAAVALGRLLRGTECVHHVDENPANNTPSNLVICPDAAYHKLLHRRTDALKATGNPNWKRCYICGSYSAPEDSDLWQHPFLPSAVHRSCQAAYKRKVRNV